GGRCSGVVVMRLVAASMAAAAALLGAVAMPRALADESGGHLAKPGRELSGGAGARGRDAPPAVIRTAEDYQVPSVPLVRGAGSTTPARLAAASPHNGCSMCTEATRWAIRR